MRNVIRVTAVAGFFVFGIGGAHASDHTALWAQGGDDRAIEWSGSNSTVTGTIHSNGGLKVTGRSNSVTGATEWVTVLNVNLNQNQFDPAPVQVPAAPWPLVYDVADYQPGSSKALAAGAAYVDATSECASGNWQRVFRNVDLEPALYWIPCDVTFNAKNVTGQITIVSTGKVHLIAGRETHLESHTDGLLVLTSAGDSGADDDNDDGSGRRKVIHVTGSRAELGGYLVAEYGEIHLAGSRQNLECGMFGRSIKISGSKQTINGAACGVVANTPPVANPDEAATDEDVPVLIDVLVNDSDADGNLDSGSVLIASSPANGTVSVDAISGAVTYTPAPQFFGTDEFSYTVADDAGAVSAAALVNIAVASVNDPPIGTVDSATTAEDTGILIDVLLNDFDPDGSLDATSVIVVQAPVNGTTVVDPISGEILYTPDADFNGDDPFSYLMADNEAAESEHVLVEVTVTAVNDAPVADPDTAATPEDSAVAIDLLANDSDVDDPLDPASILITTAPQFGTVAVDVVSGVATYTPDSDFAGDDSFSYTLTDPAGATSVPAQVSLTVTPLNDAPSATDLAATTDEDTSVLVTLAGTDSDGDPITFSVVDLPVSGDLAGSPPDLTYTPASNFAGTDTFTYTASDGVESSNLATVTITVLAINDPPFVVADDATTPEDTLVIIDVLANDGDVDGVLDPASVVVVTAATQGTTSVDAGSGAISYTPSLNFVGDDSFTYSVADNLGASSTAVVNVTVTSVNDSPSATDLTATVSEDESTQVTLIASDPDGDAITFSIIDAPANGVLSGTAPDLTYTPAADFAGSDSFSYTASDGTATSNIATVTVNVLAVNDAPVAVADDAVTPEDTPVVIDVLANDGDIDGTLDATSVVIVNASSHGTTSVDAISGVVTYVPAPDFFGTDEFSYTVADNLGANSDSVSVSLTVTPVNDAPAIAGLDVSLNEDGSATLTLIASDPDGDAITFSIIDAPVNGVLSGTAPDLTYTPAADFAGSDSFSYTASDGTATSNTATVTITVNPVNDAPVAVDDTATTPEDTDVVIDVLANDGDVDSPLDYTSVVVVDAPAQGSTSVDAISGMITYTPAANFFGDETFTYVVADSSGVNSEPATVNVSVLPVNDAPTGNSVAVTTDEDAAFVITLTGFDVDGDALTFTILSAPTSGTLSGTAPNLVYTPAPDFFGADSLSFVVSDGVLESATAAVTITVDAVNDAPVANDIGLQATAGSPETINLTGSDPDGDVLSYQVTTQPEQGSLSGTAPELNYTANAGFSGTDSFAYVVNDGLVDSAPATVTITVSDVNEAPSIVSAPITTALDGSVYQYDVEATDPNGDVLSFVLSEAPSGASIDTLSGLIDWTPDPALTGHNVDDNQYCAVTEAVGRDAQAADIVFIVDESLNTGGTNTWVSELAGEIQVQFMTEGIGAGAMPNRYSVVAFANTGRVVTATPSGFTDILSLRDDLTSLPELNSSADGYTGINTAMTQLQFRPGVPKKVFLITGRNRTVNDPALNFDNVLESIQDADVEFTAIVNARWACPGIHKIFGSTPEYTGFAPDYLGGYETVCTDAYLIDGSQAVLENYINLAFETGGYAWYWLTLTERKQVPFQRESFTYAIAREALHKITDRLEVVAQPDLVVSDLSYDDVSAAVTVRNRGSVDVDDAIDLRLSEDGVELAVEVIPGLLAGGTTIVTIPVSAAVTHSLTATVTSQNPAVEECFFENNSFTASAFTVIASDPAGLSDTQRYSVAVVDNNEAPVIDSVPPAVAPLGLDYEYQVSVADPDSGDSARFDLIAGPTGMTIHEVAGVLKFRPESSQVGVHTVTVQATDLGGLTATQTFNLTIDNSYLAPRFLTTPDQKGFPNTVWTYAPLVEVDPTATATFGLVVAPAGFQLDPGTGAMSWLVPDGFDFGTGERTPVIVQLQDSFGNVTFQRWSINHIPPHLGSIYWPNWIYEGDEFDHDLTVFDINQDAGHVWDLLAGPAGMTLEPIGIGSLFWPDTATTSTNVTPQIDTDTECGVAGSNHPNLNATVRWQAGYSYTMARPVAGPLYDSNGDNQLDANDRLAVLGVADNRAVAVDARTGRRIWRNAGEYFRGSVWPALTDLDGDADAELLLMDIQNRVAAVASDGAVKMRSEPFPDMGSFPSSAMQVVDLEGDGDPEILFGPKVLDSQLNLLFSFPIPSGANGWSETSSVAADLNGDGVMEVFFHNQLRSANGDLLWTLPMPGGGNLLRAFYAVADFDNDGTPEFVVSEYRSGPPYWVRLFNHDGTQIWEERASRVGPPLIANFDLDDEPEIYLPASNKMLEADGTTTWYRSGTDNSARATAADMDGDGDLEILRFETSSMRIIDGATGQTRSTAFAANNLYRSSPILVDLDGDGIGELIVPDSRLKLLASANGDWMPGPRVFAQQPFVLGNVNDDLTVPQQFPYWQSHNSVGVTAPAVLAGNPDGRLPDLSIYEMYVKNTGFASIGVRNRGTLDMPGPIDVSVYADAPITGDLLGQRTISAIGAGSTGSGSMSINIDSVASEVFAVVTPPAGVAECETGNNTASAQIVRPMVTDDDDFTDVETYGLGIREKIYPPVFSSTPPPTAVENSLYTYQVTATDENRFDSVRFSFATAPEGASINALTGLVSWTPDFGQAGTRNFTIRALDLGTGSRTQSFSVSVSASGDPNSAPVITSTPVTTVFAGQSYHYDVDATDADNPYLAYTLQSAPAGMQQNALSGAISWTPTLADLGSVNVTTTATDPRGASDTQSFTIVVSELINSPPNITSTPNTQIAAGQAYTYQVVATDPDGDLLSYSLDSSLPGMTVSTDGLVEWTPDATQTGANEVIVRVTDSYGNYATQTYTLNVGDANRPPDITSTPSNNAAPGVEYTYQVVATDPDGDTIIYSLDTAPSGMDISPSGLVTWTPVQTGSFGVAIRVADSFGNARIQTYSIVVANQSPPQITSTAVLTATAGATYSYDVEATDADGDTLQYVLTEAPAGMIIGSANGVILWTPEASQIGDHSVTVTVDDFRGGSDSQSYTITVSAAGANNPPDVTSVPSGFGKDGFAYSYQVEAIDPDGDTLVYQLLSAPAGMTVSATGLVEWTPTAPGLYYATLRVSDAQYFVQQDWSIDIAAADAVLAVAASVDPRFADPAQTITVTTQVSGQAAPATVMMTVDGAPVSVDANGTATFAASNTLGRHDIVITADDGFDTATINDAYYTRDSSDNVPPVVEILTPLDGDTITSPTAVLANVSDDNLVEWRLLIAERGSNAFVEIATGDLPLAAASAGDVDPTLLLNGFQDLLLEATDAGGNVVGAAVTVEIDGDMKVGHFSFTVEDLSTPVVGIPITVNRTYDTRRKHENLDFGYGWTIDYQNVRVQENRVLGTGWEVTSTGGPFPTMCIEPVGRHGVSVRLPDGELARFDMTVEPSCQFASPPSQANPVFTARSGTTASLVAEDVGPLLLNGGELLDGSSGQPFDVSRYTLTTLDGFTYELDQGFGIRSVTDLSGNTLTYSDSGIVHSSGKAVAFNRDAQGRITAITDPAGKGISYSYDAAGDLISVTNRVAEVTEHDYDGAHTLTDYRDPRGVTPLRNIYDLDGRLIRTIDADGNEVVMDHDLAGNTETVTDRRGNPRTLVYDDEGNVLSNTNALGETTSYTYDANGNELTVTDPLGNVTARTYDADNNVLTETDPLGNVTTNTFDARGNLLSITDANSNAQVMTYNGPGGQLNQLTDALGNTSGFAWGTSGVLGTQSDALNNTTTFGYDDDGNRTRQTDPLGVISNYTFDANGNELSETTTRTDELGAEVTLVTTMEYDDENRLITFTDAEGNVSQTEYNAIGKESAQIDPLGQRTEMSYDNRGNLTTTSYTDGTTETVTYDANNNELSRTDRNDNTTSFTYDAANRLTVTTLPDGATVQTVYDAAGRVIAKIDALGNRTDYTPDAAGRRTQVTDALGNVTTFAYDNVGNLLSMTDARGNTTTYEYDAANRRTKTIFPDLTEMTVAYNALGRKVAETDQAGNTTAFAYDPLGRLTTVTDALNQVTSYTYDEQSNKLTQTDAENRTTSWTYDNLGRVLSRTLPLGQVESFTYNANGIVLTHTDFNGALTTLTYDVNDRLLRKDFADATFEAWTYTDTGLVATETDVRGGVTTNTYDNRDRLTRVDHPDGTFISYTYDAQGNRTSVTTPTGTTAYTFDVLNRLSTVTDPQGGITTYGYDAVGNRASIAYPNGTSTAYTYSDLNRLTNLTHSDATSAFASFSYTLGAAGNRTRIEDHTGRTVDYTYDATYKLLTETVTPFMAAVSFEVIYAYDAVGNRLTKTIGGIDTTTYTYDDNDRLITETSPSTTTTYSYDANGNTTAKDDASFTTTYVYDLENQLSDATTPSGTTSYTYDIDGIRTGQITATLDRNFLLDKNRAYAQVLAEFDPAGTFATTGAAEVTYVYGDDLLSQDHAVTGASYYHYDGLGSTRALTDAAGAVTDTYLYEAFGELLEQTGTTSNDYLYTGEQYDANVGFYYLRARYYNPAAGRFQKQDTFLGVDFDSITLHKYLYAGADPVNAVDPSGLNSVSELGATQEIRSAMLEISSQVQRLIGFYEKAQGVRDIITAADVLIKFVNGEMPDFASTFRDGLDLSGAASAFGKMSKDALGIGITPWVMGYMADSVQGARIEAYIIYMPALAFIPSKLVSSGFEINDKPVKIGFGSTGPRSIGSLAGIGLVMMRERQLMRMDLGPGAPGHQGGSHELDHLSEGFYSMHVYDWWGGPR